MQSYCFGYRERITIFRIKRQKIEMLIILIIGNHPIMYYTPKLIANIIEGNASMSKKKLKFSVDNSILLASSSSIKIFIDMMWKH